MTIAEGYGGPVLSLISLGTGSAGSCGWSCSARPPGHATVVVDMTRTRFCDSSGFSVLVAAHQRALAEGGGLRLVIPAGSPALRVFRAIGLGRFIRRFASLEQALNPGPAAASPQVPVRPSAEPRQPARHADGA